MSIVDSDNNVILDTDFSECYEGYVNLTGNWHYTTVFVPGYIPYTSSENLASQSSILKTALLEQNMGGSGLPSSVNLSCEPIKLGQSTTIETEGKPCSYFVMQCSGDTFPDDCKASGFVELPSAKELLFNIKDKSYFQDNLVLVGNCNPNFVCYNVQSQEWTVPNTILNLNADQQYLLIAFWVIFLGGMILWLSAR